jgi:phage gp36-like protein
MEVYTNSDLNYSTYEGFKDWISEQFSKIISSDDVNYFDSNMTISDEEKNRIIKSLVFAESEIDSILSIRYQVPLQNNRSILIVKLHTYTIAAYNLYTKTGVDKSNYFKYKQTIETLMNYGNGKRQLFGEDMVNNNTTFSGGNTWENPFKTSTKSIL